MKVKVLTITIISFISIIGINYLIYGLLTAKTPNADFNLESRGIETPLKLLLSGYLGLFFGFKYLGTVNWLVIPLFVVYLILIKPKFTRDQKALLVVLMLSLVLIALKGYFNQRYQLTLIPLVFLFTFLFVWKIFTHLNNPFYLREISMVFILLNSGHYTWHMLYGPRVQEKVQQIFEEKEPVKEPEVNYTYVHELTDYVDSLPTKETFLVNNLPDFYYRTSKKGLYYWCQDDFYHSKKGIIRIFENRSEAEAFEFITVDLGCRYIYTYEIYNKYSARFEEFLNKRCTLIAKDREGKQLFEINNE